MDQEKFARGTATAEARPLKKRENCKTRVCGVVGGVFLREPLGGQIAMARYEAPLRIAVQDHDRDRVFVAVVDSDGRKTRHAVLGPGDSIVLGRHEQARLQHESEDVSLRHVAIAVAPSSTAAAPLLRVWDLVTGRPFKTEDGMPTKAITADGPVFATVGAIFIAIIPLSSLPKKLPLGTLALWHSLPERKVISRVAEGSVVESLPPAKAKAKPVVKRRTTMVTRVGPVSGPMDCPPELAVAELRLATSAGSRRYRISMEALERGILIGRYERCLNLGGDEISVLSRVHLLISKIGLDVVAIDTASTFGSIRKSDAFESVVLRDQDKMLLADVLLVEWKYKRPVLA
jgi:hypothetical protein